MDNTDKNLQEYFKGFQPEIDRDDEFLNRLNTSLNAIDAVRKAYKKEDRINRFAAMCAFVVGFILGGLSTVFYPLLSETCIKVLSFLPFIEYHQALLISFIGIMICISAYSTYDIVLILCSRRNGEVITYRCINQD